MLLRQSASHTAFSAHQEQLDWALGPVFMDTRINTLPQGLSWVAYPLITGWRRGPQNGHYQILNKVNERAFTVQRESTNWFCKSNLPWNTVAVLAWVCTISPYSTPFLCFLIQGAVVDYSSDIFHPWFSLPSLLGMQIWSVTNDVGPSLTRSSPWCPHVAPQLTSSSSTVITLVGLLRLIILDFGMHCHCLHSLAPHTACFW